MRLYPDHSNLLTLQSSQRKKVNLFFERVFVQMESYAEDIFVWQGLAEDSEEDGNEDE